MDQLVSIITYFAILSVAAERLTEMLKNAFLGKLTSNAAVYQGISGVFGAVLSLSAPLEMGSIHLPTWASVIVTGLAVSGGSGMWNTILSTMTELKNKVKINNANQKA